MTKAGDVGFANQFPEEDPTAIGVLPFPLSRSKNRLLVGSYPAVSPAQLASGLKITPLPGDGDECGGSAPYVLTYTTSSGAPPVGAAWVSGYATFRPCG